MPTTGATVTIDTTVRRAGGRGSDYARVLDVTPLVERVRYSEPVEQCFEVARPERRVDRNGSTVLGGVIGAVVGSQFGAGDGRRAATVAGALLGGAVGRDRPAAPRRAAIATIRTTVNACATKSAAQCVMKRASRSASRLPRDVPLPRPPPGDRAAVRSGSPPARRGRRHALCRIGAMRLAAISDATTRRPLGTWPATLIAHSPVGVAPRDQARGPRVRIARWPMQARRGISLDQAIEIAERSTARASCAPASTSRTVSVLCAAAACRNRGASGRSASTPQTGTFH